MKTNWENLLTTTVRGPLVPQSSPFRNLHPARLPSFMIQSCQMLHQPKYKNKKRRYMQTFRRKSNVQLWDKAISLRTVSQSIDQSISQSTSQSIDQSINRSVNQSNSQSIDQSINRSINQSVNRTVGCDFTHWSGLRKIIENGHTRVFHGTCSVLGCMLSLFEWRFETDKADTQNWRQKSG